MISGSKHSWKRINKRLRAPGLRPKSNGAMRHCHQSGGVEPDLLRKMGLPQWLDGLFHGKFHQWMWKMVVPP